MNDGGAFRIALVERIPKRLGAMLGQKRGPLLAHGVAYLLARREIVVVNCGPHIEPRAAREHAALAARIDVGETCSRVFLEQRRRICLARLANIKTPVRYHALGRGQFTRANIHAFINLHGVGRYHFPIYATCDFLRDIGFARRRRTHNNDNGLRQLKGWLLARLRHRRPRPTNTR